jgi:hypothetical protein
MPAPPGGFNFPARIRTRSILLRLILVVGLCSSTMGQSDNHAEAEKLMKQSEELADIRSPGSHAFLLQARVKLFDEKGHANEGSYRLAWKAPDDWQDELTPTDFRQVRTAKVDKLFYSRSTRGLRPDVFHLLGLLEYPGHFDFREPKRLKLRDKSENGVAERIVEYSPEGQSWKVTYDAKSPIVLRVEYSVHSVAYEYSDYVTFDQHQFPRLVKKSSRNKPLIEIQIQKLEEVDIKTYLTPPSDSRYLQWCPNLKFPKTTATHTYRGRFGAKT